MIAGATASQELESGVPVFVFDQLETTMGEARARFEPASGPFWVVAQRQIRGVGRRGRAWHHQPGNLAATLALPHDRLPVQLPLTGFCAGLAVLQAAAELCVLPATRLALKWPNDVLVDGAKVAGILLETIEGPAGKVGLLLGIGVNITAKPEGIPYPVTMLSAVSAVPVEPMALLKRLDKQFWSLLATLNAAGFEPIRSAWQQHAYRLGEEIRISAGDRTMSGRFEGIGPSGALRLVTHAGTVDINAGDVLE